MYAPLSNTERKWTPSRGQVEELESVENDGDEEQEADVTLRLKKRKRTEGQRGN